MPDDLVLHRLNTGVLELVLNRPDKLNAFTPDMHVALRAQFDRAAQDSAVRAVLLTGGGRGSVPGRTLATATRATVGQSPIWARPSAHSITTRSSAPFARCPSPLSWP